MIPNKVTHAVGVLISELDAEIRDLADASAIAEGATLNPKLLRYAMDCALLRERLGRLLAGWEGRRFVDEHVEEKIEAPVPTVVPAPRETPKLALSRTEAAEALGVSAITVDRLVVRGLLRPSLATRRPMFSPSELERFMRETSRVDV